MVRLLKSMGQEVPATKRILEINPAHPLFSAMNRIFEKDKNEPILKDFILLLYDQALLLEGSKPQDPSAFAQAIAKLMVENLEKTG
jgi:molecular chaperone HtpG